MAFPKPPPGFELIQEQTGTQTPAPPDGFQLIDPVDPFAHLTPDERKRFIDPAARPAQPGDGQGLGQTINQAVREMLDPSFRPAFGPELGDLEPSLVGPVSNARTLQGKLNLVRQRFPNAALDVDEHGRRGFRLNEDTLQRGGILGEDKTIPAGQFVFFDKPQITASDLGDPKRFIENNITTMIAGGSAAPANALVGMAATGAGAAFDEAIQQKRTSQAGADEGFSLSRIATNAAAAAAGEGAGRLVTYTGGLIAKRVAALLGEPVDKVVQGGRLTDSAKAALQKEGIDENEITSMAARALQRDIDEGLTPQQAMRAQDFEKIGAKPTRGEITRTFDDMQFEAETAKQSIVGSGLRQRAIETNTAINQALDDMRAKSGGTAVDPEDIGAIAKDALRLKKQEMQTEISKLYTTLSETSGSKKVLPKKMVASVIELKRFENLSPELKTFRDGLTSRIVRDGKIAPVTVDDAMILRQELIDLVGTDIKTNARLRQIINALDDDVVKMAPRFKTPIEAARKKLAEFEPNIKLLQKHGEDATNIVQRLFEGKVDNRDLMNVVINKSGKTKDLIALKKSLLTGTKEQAERGRKVWGEMRNGTLVHLMNESIRPGEADSVVFSGALFASELDRIGNKKLAQLFNNEEFAMLHTIRRIGEARIPVPGSVNTSNTASAIINYLSRAPGIEQLKGALRLLKATKSLKGADPIRKTASKQANKKAQQVIRNFRNRLLSPATGPAGAELGGGGFEEAP